jgi:hypothetical protein
MKGKTLLCLAIVLSMTLTMMPAMVAAPPAEPYLEVVFQATGTNTYIIESCTPPVTDIKVNLTIHGVTNMWGWSTVITWNPAVLNCTGKGPVGPFNPAGTSVLGVIDNVGGTIPKLAASTTEEDTVTGTGIIYTLTFMAHHQGSSWINISESNYKPYGLEKVYVNEVGGYFECRPYVGPPRAPTATFTPIECTQFRLDKTTGNVTVDFNACASTGSYDSLPTPGTENPILQYRWDFTGDSVVDYVSSGKITVALTAENIQDYYCSGYPYFMGWALHITWDPTLMGSLVGAEKGPLMENVTDSITIDGGFPNSGGSSTIVFAALVEVPVEDVQGSGIIAYLYFEPTNACVAGEVVVTNSKVSTWKYGPNGYPVVCSEDYTPQFAPSYSYTPPVCTASWTYSAMNTTMPVTLTVYAPDCDPSETHPDFEDTDSVTNVIHILPPIMGPDIDVYTERNGIGKGCDKDTGEEYPPIVQYLADGTPIYKWTAMSDAFGPQEAVTVYAKVTYNDEPVENKMVAFNIKDPDNNDVVWRSNATNEFGIACVEFRIPWKGVDAEDVFGAWLITATVDIAEDHVMDKCRFRFGYIVNIYYVEHAPEPVHKLGDLAVKVYFVNIAFTDKDIYLTIVLYDECGVPINQFGTLLVVDSLGMPSPQYTLTIPKWAFVGTGTLYVNVFDAPPYLMGTPMCPENGGMPSTHVQIMP